MGMQSYRQVRRILSEATKELTVLDALPNAEALAEGLETKRSAEAIR
jgi:hypothetical protein